MKNRCKEKLAPVFLFQAEETGRFLAELFSPDLYAGKPTSVLVENANTI